MKIIKRNNKYYCIYKDFQSQANIITIGNPTISNDFVVSNFSTSNWVKESTDYTIQYNDVIEINLRYKCTSYSTWGVYLCSGDMYLKDRETDRFEYSLGKSSYDTFYIDHSLNNWYRLKIIQEYKSTTSTITFSLSSDEGQTWTTRTTTFNYTSIPSFNNIILGQSPSSTLEYLIGELDLKECNIKINNNYIWKGVIQVGGYYGINDSPRYIPVDYIQGTGPQWIDTGIYPDDTTIVQSKFVMTNYSGGTFIGRGIDSESNSFRFFRYSNNTYLDYGSGDGYNRIYGSFITSTSSIYEAEFGNRYVKDLLTGITKFNSSTVSFSEKSYTIRIFDTNDYGIIYYLKIKKQGVWVRDFIPVYDTVTQKYGLYDRISNTFFGNSGTGDLEGYK